MRASPVIFKWTKEKPTDPGWYWYRSKRLGASRWIFRIELNEDDEPFAYMLGETVSYNYPEGEYAGPLPEPTDPMKTVQCPECRGMGVVGKSSNVQGAWQSVPCSKCNGSGMIEIPSNA